MSGEDTEQLRQQIQQLTDELDAAYQQIANNTEVLLDNQKANQLAHPLVFQYGI